MVYPPSVFFIPWEGENYKTASRRLLLLGESHHGSHPKSSWTIEVVKQYVANDLRETWFRTFTAIGQVVTGKTPSEIDRPEFWGSVAFYNYVQEPVPEARDRPTEQMFAAAREPFMQVLTILRPTHIIALGKVLWQHMPELDEERLPIESGTIESDCGTYKSIDGRHRALAMRIPHPVSWGFSPKAWHPLVSKFLTLGP